MTTDAERPATTLQYVHILDSGCAAVGGVLTSVLVISKRKAVVCEAMPVSELIQKPCEFIQAEQIERTERAYRKENAIISSWTASQFFATAAAIMQQVTLHPHFSSEFL